jgi:hypothetical protein
MAPLLKKLTEKPYRLKACIQGKELLSLLNHRTTLLGKLVLLVAKCWKWLPGSLRLPIPWFGSSNWTVSGDLMAVQPLLNAAEIPEGIMDSHNLHEIIFRVREDLIISLDLPTVHIKDRLQGDTWVTSRTERPDLIVLFVGILIILGNIAPTVVITPDTGDRRTDSPNHSPESLIMDGKMDPLIPVQIRSCRLRGRLCHCLHLPSEKLLRRPYEQCTHPTGQNLPLYTR